MRSTASWPTRVSPSGSGRAPARARKPGRRRRGSTRRGWTRSSPDYDRPMRADRIKQQLKNGVYRALGETASGVGAANGEDRTLRVLMYHKVNDTPENTVTVPVSQFEEQMAQLGELGYKPIALDAVIDYYTKGTPLPPQAVLITFDDGYRDNLMNAAPILQRYGYPAVVFIPVGYIAGPRPLPHDEHPASRGIATPPLDWTELAELEAAGVRVESHGIGHRPLADLEVDEAARE